MAKPKSTRHHWWPKSVSKHWKNHDGGVNQLSPNGEALPLSPINFGVIGHAHSIKLSNDPGGVTPWDECFESEFQRADDNFPSLISRLNELGRCGPPFDGPIPSRILPQTVSDEDFNLLIECIVSLAVRGPLFRERAVAYPEHLRGQRPERERNGLIGLNMRHSLPNAIKQIGGEGKAMIIFSPEREFIFGDGFFHNLHPPVQHLQNPKILAPLTPRLSVLFVRPNNYRPEPRLVTFAASPKETNMLNFAVQVYSRNFIFYRSEEPEISEEFTTRESRQFKENENFVDYLIQQIPGVHL